MDELLSLFDNDSPSSSSAAPPSSDAAAPTSKKNTPAVTPTANDAFGSFFSDNNVPNKSTKQARPSPPSACSSSKQQQPLNNKPIHKNSSTPIDPITNLRITNRHTSLAATIDLFSSCHEPKSCSVLAAMPKSEWTKYITKSSNNGGGKTNLATWGIITNDPGSKFSKSGRPFAILSLGDLPSNSSNVGKTTVGTNNVNATVSVFLFGEALQLLKESTKFYLGKGYAVGVLGFSLMPSSNAASNTSYNNSTLVSLSISDPKQLILIGKCIDVDKCRGTIRKRTATEYGNRFEDVRCGTLVDLRYCGGSGYCFEHRRQGLSSDDGKKNSVGTKSGGKSGSNNLTFMQKQREGLNPAGIQLGKQNVKVKTSSVHVGARDASSRVSEALSQAGLLGNPNNIAQSTTNPYNTQSLSYPSQSTIGQKTQMLKRAPLHMKKSEAKSEFWSSTNTPLSSINSSRAVNPYQSKSKPVSVSIASNKPQKKTDVLEAALQCKRQKTSLASFISCNPTTKQQTSSKPLKLFHTQGFDGSVQVPKPNPLFRHTSSHAMAAKQSCKGLDAQAILDRQKSLADLMKESKSSRRGDLTVTICRPNSQPGNATSKSDDPFASTFDDLPLDRETILNAKSRFGNAAEAEEYARARSIVQQLEVREHEMDQRKKHNNDNDKTITTSGYLCKTCNTKTTIEPKGCIRLRHDVRQVRELKEKKSQVGTRKERMERHGKEDVEGGLTLGSGVEWSWRGGLS